MIAHAKLTDTQNIILKAAARRPDGNIEPLPPTLRGGARTKVVDGLIARGFIVSAEGRHLLTDASYTAVGKQHPIPKDVQNADTPDGVQNLDTIPRTVRPGTKIMAMVDLLKEPGGATIMTLLQATGWLPHVAQPSPRNPHEIEG